MGRVFEATTRYSSFEDVLDDVYVRFILNLPTEEKGTFERLGFQIEQAFWFYEDFFREPNAAKLPKLTLATFGTAMFNRFPSLLKPFGNNVNRLFDQFFAYKSSIPTYGAILVNSAGTKVQALFYSSQCLMVKGWSSKSKWGFPRGKISKDEDPVDCAAREVYEEIGHEIGGLLDPNVYIENQEGDHLTRLYVIIGVDEDTPFAPVSRKEISSISWHTLRDIAENSSLYFSVKPFLKRLFKIIKRAAPCPEPIADLEAQRAFVYSKLQQFFDTYPLPF